MCSRTSQPIEAKRDCVISLSILSMTLAWMNLMLPKNEHISLENLWIRTSWLMSSLSLFKTVSVSCVEVWLSKRWTSSQWWNVQSTDNLWENYRSKTLVHDKNKAEIVPQSHIDLCELFKAKETILLTTTIPVWKSKRSRNIQSPVTIHFGNSLR